MDNKDFGDTVQDFKQYNSDVEIICRKCPFIIYKKEKKQVAIVYYWYKSSEKIILEEIEILS